MKKENSRARPGEAQRFEVDEKLIVYRFLDKQRRLICAYDDNQHYCLGSTYVVVKNPSTAVDLRFILAMLNSRLAAFHNSSLFEGVKITISEMSRLPVRTINFDDPADVASHDQMVMQVEQMLGLHEKLAEAMTPQAKRLLEQQIEITDRQIDRLVYELYGLREKEIAIVEEATA